MNYFIIICFSIVGGTSIVVSDVVGDFEFAVQSVWAGVANVCRVPLHYRFEEFQGVVLDAMIHGRLINLHCPSDAVLVQMGSLLGPTPSRDNLNLVRLFSVLERLLGIPVIRLHGKGEMKLRGADQVLFRTPGRTLLANGLLRPTALSIFTQTDPFDYVNRALPVSSFENLFFASREVKAMKASRTLCPDIVPELLDMFDVDRIAVGRYSVRDGFTETHCKGKLIFTQTESFKRPAATVFVYNEAIGESGTTYYYHVTDGITSGHRIL